MNVTNNVLEMLQAVFKEYFKQQFRKCLKNIILNVSLNYLYIKLKSYLRNYPTHCFTSPKSNVNFNNILSRLILIITVQISDNQYTHFYKNFTSQVYMYIMQGFKGTLFYCVRFCERKWYNICFFHIWFSF